MDRPTSMPQSLEGSREILRDSDFGGLLDLILAKAPIGFAFFDENFRYCLINQRLADVNGVSGAEHIGKTPNQLFPAIAAFFEHLFRTAIETGEPIVNYEVAAELPAMPGVMRHFSESWYPVHSREGKLLGVAAFIEEITERKLQEKKLRESEARFRTMAEAMPELVFTTDAEGANDYVNQRWTDWLGVDRGQARTYGWSNFVHPAEASNLRENWTKSVRAGEAFEVEHRFRRPDGSYFWVLVRALPVKDEAGKILKWVGTATDITDAKVAQDVLRDADRRKDEFLAILAHELRNPLAPISNAIQLLNLYGATDSRLRNAHNIIGRQVDHLIRLVDDLLDVSRVTQGKVSLRTEPLELSALIAGAVETTRPLIEERGHHLAVSLPDDEIRLIADPVRLRQVIANLLNNAAKYSRDQGRIFVTSERSGNELKIRVRDHGAGIARELLPHIFELFTQGEQSSLRSNGGLGIGLAVAKSIVQLHGGQIAAFSDGIGKGSEFVVTLPLPGAELQEVEVTQAKTGTDAPEQGLRILVVDDNPDAAESIAMLLELDGHQVEVAYGALEALEKARRLQPEAMLLDLGLPQIDGYELARRLRADPVTREAVLIALSGYGQPEHLVRSREAGFDHHLVKPAEPRTLSDLLNSLRQK